MMMKEKVGEVFFIAMDNPAIPGCTISKAVHDGANDIICFSLSRNTDISAEIYPYHKLIIMAEGVIEIYGADGFRRNLHTSDSIITLTDTPMGIRTADFDRDAIIARIKETLAVKEELRAKLVDPTGLPEAAVWNGNENEFDSKADSDEVGVLATENEDVRSLREMITYGLKGLLALLYLGVKNIHLGPTLPGFLSPNVAKVLVENFGIAGIGTVDEDLKLLVGETA